MSVSAPQVLLDAASIEAAVRRLAREILANHPDAWPAFVGIERRGVPLARRVATAAQALAPDRGEIAIGSLDISLYRDDLARLATVPQLHGSQIPFDADGASVVLFDDVLYTGRTIRAALEELMDFGRPARVELAVLLDRGCRELPIGADYAGHTHPTEKSEYVRVQLRELDGADAVLLAPNKEALA